MRFTCVCVFLILLRADRAEKREEKREEGATQARGT